MTARKPRPVVRVVVECYPREATPEVLRRRLAGFGILLRPVSWYGDYRRPRVVSVEKVKVADRK